MIFKEQLIHHTKYKNFYINCGIFPVVVGCEQSNLLIEGDPAIDSLVILQ